MRVVRNESGYIDNVLRSEYHGIDLGLLFRPGCPLSGVKELHLRRRIWERDEGDDDDDSARELEGRRDVLRAAQQLAGMSHLQVLVEEESCVGLTRMRKVPADHMLRLDDGEKVLDVWKEWRATFTGEWLQQKSKAGDTLQTPTPNS